MGARVERLPDQARDRELMDRIEVLQQAWQHRVDALPEGRPLGADLRRVRWMLEEYRVSLWAQHLGTAQPVSDARIRKALGYGWGDDSEVGPGGLEHGVEHVLGERCALTAYAGPGRGAAAG